MSNQRNVIPEICGDDPIYVPPMESCDECDRLAQEFEQAREEAVNAANDAQDFAESARGYAGDASDSADDAESAKTAIENMDVASTTLPAGSSATVTKTVDPNTGTVTLDFGIPQGQAGGGGVTDVVADAYSSSSTYEVGDYVIHNGLLYECNTDITTAEAFDASHWTQVTMGNELTDLKDAFDSLGLSVVNGRLCQTYTV